MSKIICAIDPGKTGAMVLMKSNELLRFELMPLNSANEPCFHKVRTILKEWMPDHIVLERSIPMAMGSKHAFTYGRGFAALEIAVQIEGFPVTYVEPAKWTKEIHEGISSDLKAKAKSLIAFERLFPHLVGVAPANTKGRIHDGFIDAILIAAYGMRKLSTST